MNRLTNTIVNIIGIIVLLGILAKLSYVFVCLFHDLDDGNTFSKIIGVTFAFASVYFVIKIESVWLKIALVFLDVMTILYYYLHDDFGVPIEYSSMIVAAYSGLILFFIGKTVSEQIRSTTKSDAERIRELETRLRSVTETRDYENERKRILRRIGEAKKPETKDRYKRELEELEHKYNNDNK